MSVSRFGTVRGISIHAAREGGDPEVYFIACGKTAFQSTPPVKAATSAALRSHV